MADPTVSNNINAFIHCKLCLDEFYSQEMVASLHSVSPREYAQIEVGWTKPGFQIWCKRHEVNVMDVDFGGAGPFEADMNQ